MNKAFVAVAVVLAFLLGGWSGKWEAREQYQRALVNQQFEHVKEVAGLWDRIDATEKKYENCMDWMNDESK